MENIIELINRIQDVFSTVGSNESLDLPQIITVGEQSSGKSSVLENIVQRDFLPRGSGIVTRRPLVLQLITLRADALESDYAEFLHVPEKKFYDFNSVRLEIEQETARIAGHNKGISRQPIHLKIYSKNVLHLTLVDLPGLTKIAIGDQPDDIEKQTRQLILDYISKPNSIILAVCPANSDIANSDSLELARVVDPAGKRTIGVVTKLDLMDAGTHALDILTGKLFSLRLGFVGLVNRSQQDILTNKPMVEAMKAEKQFFLRHPAYQSIVHHSGTPYLTQQLNAILVKHIRDKLPDLRSKLSTMVGQTQQELIQYGNPVVVDKINSGSLILRLLTMFSTEFVASIDGTSSEVSTKELSGGARIYYIFNNIFGHALDAIVPCANLTNEDIRIAIRNSTGPRCSLFIPELAFDLLVRPQIRLLEAPSLKCVQLAFEELSKICHTCGNKELLRFPKLHVKLIEVVSSLLHERLLPTSAYVESLIATQCAYININHPDFLGASGAMAAIDKRMKKQPKKKQSYALLQVASEVSHTRHRERASSVASVQSMSPPKDTFLNHFFSSVLKTERTTFGIQHKSPVEQPHPFSGYSSQPSQGEEEEDDNSDSLAPHHITSVEDSESVSANRLSHSEDLEIELIRRLVTSYFNIVRKSIQDLVPKAIMHLLVNFTRETVQNRLVSHLYSESLFATLLREDPAIEAERVRCKAMLDVYKKAFTIVNDAM
ncbi:Dynamin central region-domain-containing protein [Spinellus fusiger]|nr:Dynamin central region-domain-containing protein [Spinellus fusiger]